MLEPGVSYEEVREGDLPCKSQASSSDSLTIGYRCIQHKPHDKLVTINHMVLTAALRSAVGVGDLVETIGADALVQRKSGVFDAVCASVYSIAHKAHARAVECRVEAGEASNVVERAVVEALGATEILVAIGTERH